MSVLENTRLIVKVCKLFYEDGLSQKEIASKLGISRPQISRIMNIAKEKDIVSINIKNPFSEELELEQKLIKKYNLSDAFISNAGTDSSPEQLALFSKQCAMQLNNYILDNTKIGVMSGKTIGAVASSVQSVQRKNLHFVPLVGTLGNVGNDWNANAIARILAFKSDSTYSVLSAPILVQNNISREILMKEPTISSVLNEGEHCDLAIVGVGQISTHSTAYLSGAFTDNDLITLKESGAVASVSISYLDKNGALIENDITNRSIAWPLKRRPNTKILAIVTGLSKAGALKATLTGGYIDILMTSVPLARAMLEIDS